MMKQLRQINHIACLALALLVALSFAGSAAAQSADQAAVDRAHAFLKTEKRGRNVLSYVHFGAEFKRYQYLQTRGVTNRPKDFALVYRMNWERDGETDVAFLCDAKGNVYEVQIIRSNAQLQQPYALANLSIAVVGNLVIEAFRDRLSDDEMRQLRGMIDNPNARGLLEMSLQLQQRFGL